MNVKEGDILICIKKRKKFFESDPEEEFTNGKLYEVKKVFLGSPLSGLPFESLIIMSDRGTVRFLDAELNPNSSLGKILFNATKHIRKEKLLKLINYENKGHKGER